MKLLKGTSQVSGILQIDADQAGVTFVPSQPLSGFSLYTVVVTSGLQDRVDRPMVQTFSSTFTTIDNVPPTVVSVSPANGTLQVAPEAVVRITFSETIDPNGLGGIRLLKGGTPVTGRLDLVQNGTVAVLTPHSALATNSSYSISISGVKDTVGNVLAGTWLGGFNTLDTIVPTVTSLSLAANARLIVGLTVTVSATVADSDVARVDFYLDDQQIGSDNTAPFAANILLPKAGLNRVKAIAQDKVGNRGTATFLDLDVAADQPPTATILLPVEGSTVNTGSAFTVRVEGSDDIAVKEITLTASGAMTFSQTRTVSGTPATADFTLTVPTSAQPGNAIVLSAAVKDGAGQTSSTVQRTVMVKDSIAPTLTLASPGQTTLYKPGEQGTATAAFADNIGVTELTCTASGAATGSGDFRFDPAVKQLSQDFTFTIFADAAPHAQATIACTARDAGGNSVQRSIALQVADVVPPQVIASSISAGATEVPVNATFIITFDEPLAAATVTSVSVALTNSTTMVVPGTVTLAADRSSLTFIPSSVLDRGADYTLTVAATVTDDAGNALAAAFLRSFSTDNTAPQIVATSPVDGSQNVPVGAAVSVTFNEPLQAASVTAERIVLTSSLGPVPGTIALAADGQTVTFKPLGQLSFNRDYTMQVFAGTEDISGNAVAGDNQITFRTKVPDSDLVALWTMDGDWQDSSGREQHGTAYNGAGFETERIAGTHSGKFDGIDDYVEIGNTSSLNPSYISVEAWVKSGNPLWNSSGSILSKRNAYILHPVAESKIIRFYVFVNGQWVSATCDDPDLELTEWHHYAGTYDGTNIRIYVDGKLKGENPVTGSINTSDTGSLYIGRDDGYTDRYFKGLLDEIAIYSRALPTEDISEQYVASISDDRTPPAAPAVESVPESTFKDTVLLVGTKEAGTSIRVNGMPVVNLGQSTGWQALITLQPGQNILQITSHDAAGNESEAVLIPVDLVSNLQDILGLWHLDGDWKDSSGNGYHGTGLNGAAFSLDRKVGTQSGKFDGIDDQFPTADFRVGTGDFTIQTWIKPESFSGIQYSPYIRLFSKDNYPNTWWVVDLPKANLESEAYINFGAGDNLKNSLSVRSNGVVKLNEWSHISVVIDRTNYKVKFFINGTFDSEKNIPVAFIGDLDVVGKSFTIGSIWNYFKGLIDEVAVYKRALTDEEIQAQFGAKPSVSFTSPSQIVRYRPGETGTVSFTITHPQGVEKVICTASGAASGQLVLPPLFFPEVTDDFEFVVDADAGPNDPMTLTCSASDSSGNVGISSLNLSVADIVPPRVIGSSIQDDAKNVVGTVMPTVTFNEVLAPDSVNPSMVILQNTYTGENVAGTVILSSDKRSITFQPAWALAGATAYELSISTGVTDAAGNGLAQDYILHFTTQSAADVSISGKGTAASPYVVSTGRYGTISISGSYVVFDGLVAAGTISLTNGSVMTHKATGLNGAERLDIQATTIAIDGTSRIDVSGRGYLGGLKGGNNSNSGRTNGNVAGSTAYNSGSYAGLGGAYSGVTVNSAYGDLANPNEVGSGGGGWPNSYYGNRPGGNGGGLVRIKAASLTVNGGIWANGESIVSGSPTNAGAGSGGGIRIEVGTLSGSGAISAPRGEQQLLGFQLGPTGGCRRWRRANRNLLRFEHVPSREPRFGGRTRQQQPVLPQWRGRHDLLESLGPDQPRGDH